MQRQTIIRLFVLVSCVLGITALHYMTSLEKGNYHDIYRRLYYVPIVLGGLWFTLRGGVGTAVAVSMLYAPHVLLQWGHHPGTDPEQYLEIVLYNVIGLLTGFLTQREREQKLRYQQASIRLEESYDKLRGQADQLLEIEEQLRRADRLSALGELSAGMAHEIRNPLGAIRGTAEILHDAIAATDPHREFAQIMIREVDRLEGVVRDFLSFARPEEGRREAVDLGQALQEVLVLTRAQAQKVGVAVRVDLIPDLPLIAGNSEQLKQVFLNLVLNALQVMPEGGDLTVRGTAISDRVRLEFTDTGPGIPPEFHDRIFNPFYTTRSEGTGLGLAITHRIVTAHGGILSVRSQVGAGATFILELPAGAGGAL
jgi:signal transduction histidine kinase